MKTDLLTKIILVAIFLLLANLITGRILQPNIAFSQGYRGSGVACSADGKYVYGIIDDTIYVSNDYGKTQSSNLILHRRFTSR